MGKALTLILLAAAAAVLAYVLVLPPATAPTSELRLLPRLLLPQNPRPLRRLSRPRPPLPSPLPLRPQNRHRLLPRLLRPSLHRHRRLKVERF